MLSLYIRYWNAKRGTHSLLECNNKKVRKWTRVPLRWEFNQGFKETMRYAPYLILTGCVSVPISSVVLYPCLQCDENLNYDFGRIQCKQSNNSVEGGPGCPFQIQVKR